MITRSFIEKIRAYFDECGIKAQDGISFDNFETEFVKTLNRCKDLQDAQIAITLYRYCVKKWKKIEKIFFKHLDRWKEYNYEGATNIETVTDEEAQGTYYITNALTKYKEVYVSSASFDDELYAFEFKRGKYILGDDADYYIKFAKTDACTMKLFDKLDNLLCNIVLSDTLDVFLEKNHTQYELIIQREENDNTFIGVFEKSYIDSLGENDYIEFKNMVADIEWDLLDSKSDLGISKMSLYKEVDDITPLLYFAACSFLLYKSNKDHERSMQLASMMMLQNSIRMINNRR